MSYLYFITPNDITTKKGDLVTGERIFAIPTSHSVNITLREGEGPFCSLRHLQEHSQIYIQLKKRNPKRAHKILQIKHIGIVEGYLLVPKGFTINSEIFELWEHVVRGEQKSTLVTGAHFYNSTFMRIVEKLEQNEKGVVLAKVEIRLGESQNWIPRLKLTTLFSLNWSAQQLLLELNYACKRKVAVENTKNKYCGKTMGGIEVMFIIVNGQVKTAYPVL